MNVFIIRKSWFGWIKTQGILIIVFFFLVCFFFFCINEIKPFVFVFLDTIGVYNRLARVSVFSSSSFFNSIIFSLYILIFSLPISRRSHLLSGFSIICIFYRLFYFTFVIWNVIIHSHLFCIGLTFAFLIRFLRRFLFFFFSLFLFTSLVLFPAPLFTSSLPLRKKLSPSLHLSLTFSRQLSKTVGHFLCLHLVYPLITFPKAFHRSHFIKLFPHLAATSIAKISWLKHHLNVR